MSVALKMTLLLIGSNVFMTFAWYAHLKNSMTANGISPRS